MNPAPHRALFWLLLAAFIGLGLGWIFHVPHDPDRVFSAIPANATVVTVHRNLAAELDTILQNPATRNLIAAMGVRQRDIDDLATNAGTRAWVRLLASDRTVLAYVPALGYQRKPAWIFASWIGGQSRRLSWKLPWMRSRDLRPYRLAAGRTIWLARAKFADPAQRLSLALAEGMLLGCISTDPLAVRWLQETNDGYPQWPSVRGAGHLASARALLPAPRAHWGWWKTGWSTVNDGFAPPIVAFDLSISPAAHTPTLSAGGTAASPSAGSEAADPPMALRAAPTLSITLLAGQPLPPARTLDEHAAMKSLQAILGSSPELVVVAPLAWIGPLTGSPTLPLWGTALAQLIDTNEAPAGALAFVALLDRKHSGRIRTALGKPLASLAGKGLRVPALVAGLQVKDPARASARVERALGPLNSRYGLNLALRPDASPVSHDGAAVAVPAGRPLTLIVDEGPSLYGKFEPDECLACASIDNWLLIGSNAAVLRKLLAHDPASGTAGEGAAWRERFRTNAAACLWMDMNGCGKTFKEALAVAQLAVAAEDTPDTTAIMHDLATARDWISIAQAFKEATVAMTATGSRTRLDVAIMPPRTNP